MRRDLCQPVPPSLLLAALLTTAGCFGSHGSGRDDAGPLPDAGWFPEDGSVGPRDAGPAPRDAAPPPWDAGTSCSPYDATLTCFSHVPAGRATTVQVALGGDGCFCGETVACRAYRSGEPRTLELETLMCFGGALCDACFPFVEGTCALPPLEAGTWAVKLNGAYAYDLEVTAPDVLPERGESCLRRSARDDGCGGVRGGPVYGRHGMACHPDHAFPETRVPIRVQDGCGGCALLAGPCRVDVFDDIIRVTPSTIASGCDYDCPAICEVREDVCWTPPLREGTYRLLFDGIEGWEPTMVVTSTWDTIDPGEICGPFGTH